MRCLLITAFVSTCLTSPMAHTQMVGRSAICMLEAGSIQGHSASGIPQVSNLGNIQIRCSVPARPFPSKPGESRNGLGANAIAYDVTKDSGQQAFAAKVNPTGGGSGDGRDWVLFDILIPLRPADLDAEAHRYLTKLMEKFKTLPPSPELATAEAQQRMLGVLRETIYQSRTGHFLVECRVMDGNDAIGTAKVELEVLFKGRFSDYGLPGAPPI